MPRIFRATVTIALMALCLCFSAPVVAQGGEAESGRGLICDDAAQITRFIQFHDEQAATALDRVNAEAKKADACVVAEVVLVRGAEVAKIKNAAGEMFSIIEITVVGVATPVGMRPIDPVRQFTIVRVNTVGA